MDLEILNRLMVKVTHELSEFVPRNLFHPLGIGITLERRHLSKEEKEQYLSEDKVLDLSENKERYLSEDEGRGYLASGFAETLFYNPPKDRFLTDRQYVACELLMYLGHLISIEATDPQRPDVITNFLNSFTKYHRDYPTEQEARPFIPLLESNKKWRVNQIQAFLNDCFSKGVEKSIESVWLHIQSHAGKPGFLFVTWSKEIATTTDGQKIEKKKMGRRLTRLTNTK